MQHYHTRYSISNSRSFLEASNCSNGCVVMVRCVYGVIWTWIWNSFSIPQGIVQLFSTGKLCLSMRIGQLCSYGLHQPSRCMRKSNSKKYNAMPLQHCIAFQRMSFLSLQWLLTKWFHMIWWETTLFDWNSVPNGTLLQNQGIQMKTSSNQMCEVHSNGLDVCDCTVVRCQKTMSESCSW